MADENDLSSWGLRVGLEIHQQLGRAGDTKLFCKCPAHGNEGEPNLVIERRLRASAGETGGIDAAARAEQAKQKEYEYRARKDSACLVEMDEEPPQPVNRETLITAAMIGKACGSVILPKVQFMRKTVVDGSNPSGFQRTCLFALGGEVPAVSEKVRLQTICIEEESAKIVTRTGARDVYDLGRLGVPLIEIATDPDITTPEQAREVAAQLGMLLRSTRRVKRGLGTIRQDLNVSIDGGRRCEIKGAQDLKMLPTIISYEAQRQHSLLAVRDELRRRGVREVEVSGQADVTGEFARSGVAFIKSALASGSKAIGFRIARFAGIFGTQLCPGYRVGSEIADVARTWGFGGLIHSDEDMAKYGVDAQALRAALSLQEDDACMVLIGEPSRIADLVALQLAPRLAALLEGVPQEVRRANPDGTSSFMRPISSGERMYPETDIPLVETGMEDVQAPRLITDQVDDLMRETGLSRDLASDALEKDIPLTDYKERYPALDYAFLSSALLEWPREIETRLSTRLSESEAYVAPLLAQVASGKLASSSVKAILEEIGEHNKRHKEPFAPDKVAGLARKYQPMGEAELRKIIDDAVARTQGSSLQGIMGEVMAKARGRADGKLVMRLLKERTGQD